MQEAFHSGKHASIKSGSGSAWWKMMLNTTACVVYLPPALSAIMTCASICAYFDSLKMCPCQ